MKTSVFPSQVLILPLKSRHSRARGSSWMCISLPWHYCFLLFRTNCLITEPIVLLSTCIIIDDRGI
uniref:Uncharacterized protein n=1 Tax=Arundo donax TaxID=35708 RepID=A0A0A9HBE9_ARUDO